MSLGTAMFHGAVLAAAFVLLAQSLALPSGIWAGGIGALLGSVLASLALAARLRLVPTVFLAGAIAGSASILGYWVSGTEFTSRSLGLDQAMAWADAIRMGGWLSGGVLALRALVLRFRALLVIEAVLVVLSVSVPVAAHRDGMIARPLEIADWFWQRGLDPVYAFLGLGAVAVLLVAGTFAHARRPFKTVLQLGIVAAIAALFAMPLYHRSGDPALREPLGANGKKSGKEGDGRPSKAQQGDRPATAQDQLEEQQKDGQQGQKRPVAVVIFHKNVQPLGGVFYFRHAAFSQFNGSRLVESTRPGADPGSVWRFPAEKQAVPGPSDSAPTRTLVATDVALLSEHRRMFTLTDVVEVEPIVNPSPARFKRAYRAVSSVVQGPIEALLGRNSGDSAWDAELWEHYTSLPNDPRYLELAARIESQVRDEYQDDPMALALAVKQYMEKTTIYSFSKKYTGTDPTAEFLFFEGDRKGYCTQIAHAAAYLLRAMGVPARVGAGYGVMADNLGGGSSLLIKSGDAHAWVEVRLDEVGWVPVEIVPERTEYEPPPFEEEDLQRLLGEMARGEGRETLEAAEPIQLWAWVKAMARVLPYLLLGFFASSYLYKWGRRVRPVLTPEAVSPAYRAGLDRLAEFGFVRREGESRERFALRVSAYAPSFLNLTSLLSRSALASPESPRLGRAPGGVSAAGLAQATARELGERMPSWRRMLAAFHPAPWWWAK